MTAVSISISGRVQGVGFRAWTVRQALQLGVTGWVKNLPDGQVAVHVQGDQQLIQQFCDMLWSGPEGADVQSVLCQPAHVASFTSFEVHR